VLRAAKGGGGGVEVEGFMLDSVMLDYAGCDWPKDLSR
jgi:hypothetical protein